MRERSSDTSHPLVSPSGLHSSLGPQRPVSVSSLGTPYAERPHVAQVQLGPLTQGSSIFLKSPYINVCLRRVYSVAHLALGHTYRQTKRSSAPSLRAAGQKSVNNAHYFIVIVCQERDRCSLFTRTPSSA
jgi:hypothetical protein